MDVHDENPDWTFMKTRLKGKAQRRYQSRRISIEISSHAENSQNKKM